MPTEITPTNPVAAPAEAVEVTFEDAEAPATGNETRLTGREMILARNTHASTTYNVTITSVASPYGRTGDITQAVAPGEVYVFGPFQQTDGWGQTDGAIYFEGDNTEIEFAVVRLPATFR